jgi:hypothetical protein
MIKFTNLALVPMAVAMAMAASACDSAGDSGSDDNGSDTGGSAGTGGSATGGSTSGTGGSTSGTGGTGATDPTGTVLQPSTDGWMDRTDIWNDLGIQGSWYPYGDQYGTKPTESKCLTVGMHMPAECSIITSPPPPPETGFPQATPGMMCTTGEVAVILPCVVPDLMTSGCPEKDYSNMWGAGIGFDVNADKGEDGGMKYPWDPMLSMAGPVIGFSFDIDTVPLPKLRVEIPMILTDTELAAVVPPLPAGATTDDHPDGAPYWGADMTYPASPVMPGNNKVTWDLIKPPRIGNYEFLPNKMLGIQFHVPAVPTAPKGAYSFCISNVKFLRM